MDGMNFEVRTGVTGVEIERNGARAGLRLSGDGSLWIELKTPLGSTAYNVELNFTRLNDLYSDQDPDVKSIVARVTEDFFKRVQV